SMLLKRVDDPKRYGVAVVEGKKVVDIIEKPETPKSNLINASVYIGGAHLLNELENVPLSKRGEYEITDALYNICEEGRLYGIEMRGYWNDIGTPWNLLDANEYYMELIEEDIRGKVEDSIVKGKVVVEEGAQVIGSYIEGPCYIAKGAIVGPSAHILKHSYIGPGCKICGFTIVKNSIILDGTKAKHHAYIGDSLVGRYCNFGSSTQIANLRFDRKTVKMRLNGTEYDSGRQKLGCVVGSNVSFGAASIVFPGKKIGSNSIIWPGAIVSEDVPQNMRVIVKQAIEHAPI
ncbi:MAG: bifunctional sugar-1-phosphate nucleotidylyltransferase/acetyltransferase, partial [Candidatus Micrarchaeia archaeon]